MQFTANHPNFVKLILVESVGMKGYPIFKKIRMGAIVSSLVKTKEEIAQDPVQIAPVLDAIKI